MTTATICVKTMDSALRQYVASPSQGKKFRAKRAASDRVANSNGLAAA